MAQPSSPINSGENETIAGVFAHSTRRFEDQRGSFCEVYHQSLQEASAINPFTVRQVNETFSSQAGVMRGLHVQWAPYMGKLVRAVQGRVLDIILDLRVGSLTYGCVQVVPLVTPSDCVWVPVGCAHGTLALNNENTRVLYLCSGEYSGPANEASIDVTAPDLDWSRCASSEIRTLCSTGITRSRKDAEGGLSLTQWAASAQAAAADFRANESRRAGPLSLPLFKEPPAAVVVASGKQQQQHSRSCVLVTGGSGTLGRCLQNLHEYRRTINTDVIYPSHRVFDVCDLSMMREYVIGRSLSAIVHCAAITHSKVNEAPLTGAEVNIVGTFNVVKLAQEVGAHLVYVSTDYVFRGDRGNYGPSDEVGPTTLYGWQKLAGEAAVRTLGSAATIVRGSFAANTFNPERAFSDQWTTRMPVDFFALALLRVITAITNNSSSGNDADDAETTVRCSNVQTDNAVSPPLLSSNETAVENTTRVVHFCGPQQTVADFVHSLHPLSLPPRSCLRAEVCPNLPFNTSLRQ